jgi:hypothetical protein
MFTMLCDDINLKKYLLTGIITAYITTLSHIFILFNVNMFQEI